ncbi:MAG: gamma-glutamyl-gamma-aminobutyrate hydrolase family protein [Actinomycetia bacterium]|nr:gamma-glutamyl-gamma-aminobutyrate hydrolase family protein [Actinomycetes bacterium]
MSPVIAVSCYGEPAKWGAWDTDAVLLHRAYVDALQDVGAAVLLVPPGATADTVRSIVDRVDGLIIAGGPDIDPNLYGEEAQPTTDRPRTDRDATELLLYPAARARQIPVLGICRGMQVMAVASGGRLVQDLPSAGYGQVHRDAPGTFEEHGASFSESSLVAQILGTDLRVNSSHHQGVDDPGSLAVTGRAADGTIEALEDPQAAFVLGVQWHPEMTDDRRLFAALVAAAN